MAITGAITLSDNQVLTDQVVSATLTITNGGASAVTLTGVEPKIWADSSHVCKAAGIVGNAPIPAGGVVIAASGTYTVDFGVSIGAVPDLYGSRLYVEAEMRLSDNSVTAATATEMFVSDNVVPNAPAGRLWFNHYEMSGLFPVTL